MGTRVTKGQLFNQLMHLPDDTAIQFNVEYENRDNWDAANVEVCDMSYLCPGGNGCNHTGHEIVIFIKK